MKMRILLMIALMISLAQNAIAAEYYMSPFGNDSNPGTLAAPWRTLDRLQRAQSSLRPGDTVWFLGGNYVINDSAAFLYYRWNTDGTASAHIKYRNYQNQVPVIVFDRRVYNNPQSWGYIFGLGDYIEVDGLTFLQTEPSRALGMVNGVTVNKDMTPTVFSSYGTGVEIRNCTIENFSGLGIFYHGRNILVENNRIIGTGSHGFYVAGYGGTFRYNELDGSRGYSNQYEIQLQYETCIGNLIYGNLIKNGRAANVVLSGSVANNQIFNNVFINNVPKLNGDYSNGLGYFCWKNYDGTPARVLSGNKFYNNTMIGKYYYVIDTKIGLPSGSNCGATNGGRPLADKTEIYNNIFYPIALPDGSLESLPLMKNNIFFNIRGSLPAGNTLVNPNLVNPSGSTSADAMLQAGSPAIDQATSGAPALDYRSGARPVGAAADVGAFEYGAPPGSGGGPVGGGGSPSDPNFPCI
ncbi:MAG: right-handed parallel beta-helix repeat-containing protein [Candidatus Omnitrophica bacterium]|nr:right-handed parallel beta-helix repeat-containing protein [Candidatus Omnitrophota bacterium]